MRFSSVGWCGWRISWNTSAAFIFTSAPIAATRSPCICNEGGRAAGSGRRPIPGTTSSEPGRRPTRRPRISKRSGRRKAWPPRCFQGRPGKAGSNPSGPLLPNRRRLPRQLLPLPYRRPRNRRLRLRPRLPNRLLPENPRLQAKTQISFLGDRLWAIGDGGPFIAKTFPIAHCLLPRDYWFASRLCFIP